MTVLDQQRRLRGVTEGGTAFTAMAQRMVARVDHTCEVCGTPILRGCDYWRVNAFASHVVCTGCADVMSTESTAPSSPPLADLDPHRPEQRYRLYRRRGAVLECVAAVADEAHVVALIRDQRDPDAGATISDDDAVGLLDSHGLHDVNPLDDDGNYTLPGSWLIKPWAR